MCLKRGSKIGTSCINTSTLILFLLHQISLRLTTATRTQASGHLYDFNVYDGFVLFYSFSWWEGEITEKSKKDEPMVTVNFPGMYD